MENDPLFIRKSSAKGPFSTLFPSLPEDFHKGLQGLQLFDRLRNLLLVRLTEVLATAMPIGLDHDVDV